MTDLPLKTKGVAWISTRSQATMYGLATSRRPGRWRHGWVPSATAWHHFKAKPEYGIITFQKSLEALWFLERIGTAFKFPPELMQKLYSINEFKVAPYLSSITSVLTVLLIVYPSDTTTFRHRTGQIWLPPRSIINMCMVFCAKALDILIEI